MAVCFAGTVVKIGPGVTRFQVGDRVVTNSAGTLRNDARFGALQRYALTTQQLTAKVLPPIPPPLNLLSPPGPQC
jgi:NADPH:quinone reductase-like Zn-dependent oxidoreductase